ncbi:hypothetical protein EYR40_001516 [Pleurotus pulmonarius]|nr:hypothetical protein EYR38_004759 [Pleurotus pulmonarius]KAF4609163.1 hypothetical protein EYR40_001516 [Pleurotus pulmonarius]
MHCGCSEEARNIVVCIDGTSNQFGQKNTNVIELYHQLDKDNTQRTYYNSGIGTYAKPSMRSLKYVKLRLDNKVDLAIAWNFERIIMAAYRWLVDNYKDGDRIFLFGFSRGAYQVRTIAAMIEKVGLIHKGNEEQIPFAYELYAGQTAQDPDVIVRPEPPQPKSALGLPPPETQTTLSPAESFKQTFSRKGVKVHFIGAWDTVSSIGVVRDKSLPGTDAVEKTCCYFRHALALDERRVKFLPEYSHGGATFAEPVVDRGTSNVPPPQPLNIDRAPINPRVKEVWFPGTHSDILDRGHAALLWMSYEANTAGLKTHPSRVDWKWENLSEVHESLTAVWFPMEYLPVKRLSYKSATSTVWRPHAGQGRIIKPGQKIHASVAFCEDPYRPKAILPPNATRGWDALVGRGKRSDLQWTQGWEHLLEMDIFNQSTASQCLDTLKTLKDTSEPSLWLHRLEVMTWSGEGCRTLLKVDNVSQRLLDAMSTFKNIEHQVTASYIVVKLGQTEVLANYLHENNVSPELALMLIYREPLFKKRLGLSTYLLADVRFRHQLLEQTVPEESDLIHTLLNSLKDNSYEQSASLSSDLEPYLQEVAFQRHACQILGQLVSYEDSRPKLLHPQLINGLLSKTKATEAYELRCDALIALAELVKHEELREILQQLQLFAVIAECLREDQWHIQQLSVSVISQLVSSSDNNLILVSPLLNILSEATPDDLMTDWPSVTSLILAMVRNDSSREAILESKILQKLYTPSIYFSSIATLADLLKIAVETTVFQSDIAHSEHPDPVLISAVSRNWRGSYHDKVDIIQALVHLANNDITRFALVGSSVGEIIQRGLRDVNWFVNVRMLWFVEKLGVHGIFRRKSLDSDILELIFSAIESPDTTIQRAAMKTISVLVNNSDIHQKLLQSSIIYDLVDLAKSRAQLVILAKLKVIAELIRYDPLRAEILRSGFLDSLFEENSHLINDSAKQLQTPAFEIILQFIEHDDSRASILGHDIFNVLLQRSLSKYPHIRAMAVKVMTASACQADTHERMLEQRFTSSLFEAIRQTSFYARSALQVVTSMVAYDTLRHGLLEANLLVHLQEKLGDQSNYVVVLATLQVFSKLLDYDDSRARMNIEALIEHIVKLTDHENRNIRQQVISMLTNMLKFDHTRKKFLDVDVMFDLKWLLRGQDTEVSMVYCVYEMTKHDDSREQLLGVNILQELTALLRSDSAELRVVAANCLAELAQDPRFLPKFSKVSIRGLEARLRNMYWASESDSERQAMDDASRKVASLVSAGTSGTSPPVQNDVSERGRGPAVNKSAMKSPDDGSPRPSKRVSFLVHPATPEEGNFGSPTFSSRIPPQSGQPYELPPGFFVDAAVQHSPPAQEESVSPRDSPPRPEAHNTPARQSVPVQNDWMDLLLGRGEESQQRHPSDVAYLPDIYPTQPDPAYTYTSTEPRPLPRPLPPDMDAAASEGGNSSPERPLALEYWDETSEATEEQRPSRAVIDWSRISPSSDTARVESEASSSADPEDALNYPDVQPPLSVLPQPLGGYTPATDRPSSPGSSLGPAAEPLPTSEPMPREPVDGSEAIRELTPELAPIPEHALADTAEGEEATTDEASEESTDRVCVVM